MWKLFIFMQNIIFSADVKGKFLIVMLRKENIHSKISIFKCQVLLFHISLLKIWEIIQKQINYILQKNKQETTAAPSVQSMSIV